MKKFAQNVNKMAKEAGLARDDRREFVKSAIRQRKKINAFAKEAGLNERETEQFVKAALDISSQTMPVPLPFHTAGGVGELAGLAGLSKLLSGGGEDLDEEERSALLNLALMTGGGAGAGGLVGGMAGRPGLGAGVGAGLGGLAGLLT